MRDQYDSFLRSLFDTAVNAVRADRLFVEALPEPPRGRTVVVGAGKAAASMAAAIEHHMEANWPGPVEGLVVTRYGHGRPCKRIEVVEAAHPVPDAAGRRAAERILELARGLGPDDLLLCLISGGGSSLLALPAPGISLEDKRQVARDLLRSGASIGEMNTVRKHLSAIKGGRLAAAAHPARVVTIAVSDVPGDDPAVIASGPTVPDPSTFAEARAVLAHYGIRPPTPVADHLATAAEETPKPGDPRLAGARTVVVATASDALDAAARLARAQGWTPLVLSDAIEGEAREVAKVLAAIARHAARRGLPVAPPAVILSGGETTVTVRGRGRGGRNVEFLAALALALDGHPGIHAIACDTDGIDGTEDNAGAVLHPDSLDRARALGLDPAALLADNDGYHLFQALHDLVKTGPTLTNVNDFRAILVTAHSSGT